MITCGPNSYSDQRLTKDKPERRRLKVLDSFSVSLEPSNVYCHFTVYSSLYFDGV